MSTNRPSKKPRSDHEVGSEAWLLDCLDQGGKNGLSPAEILARLPGDDQREELPGPLLQSLERLEERGLVTHWARRWYRISRTEWRVGRVGRGLEEGTTEVRRLDPVAGSSFARQSNLKGARRGDLVLLKRLGGAGKGTQTEGVEVAVVRILARAHPTMVGTVRRSEERVEFLIFQGSGGFEISSDDPLIDQALPGVYFTARIAPVSRRSRVVKMRSNDDKTWERVELVERLGREGEPGVDVDVVLRHFDIPDTFPEEVLSAAERFGESPETTDVKAGPELVSGERVDLRGLTTVTIDGETARDFDDAISVEDLSGGRLRLGVHVADVAEYVTDQSVLDAEAERRGTSVYLPDRVVPMLPEKLSNGLCSLNPAVPRFAVSVFMEFDRSGAILSAELTESLIESDSRLTYDQVAAWLDAWEAGGVVETGQTKGVDQTLRCAGLLVKRLLERRSERGSLDFDFPVSRVEVDSDGQPTGVVPESRNRAHRLIEEFMVAANEAVSKFLVEAELAAIFRRHDPPALSRIEDMSLQLEHLGLTVDEEVSEELFRAVGESPRPLSDLQEMVRGLPEEEFVASLILMSLKRAIYHPKNAGHYALGLEHYCHFTSPIRRYPDLLVHRQVKRVLRHEDPIGWSRDRLYSMADHCSITEQRAERAERELSQWKKVRWLAERLGEKYRGRVTGVQPFGLFVQLEDVLVDGLLPIGSLGDDYYVFDQDRLLLEGSSTGRVFRLADRLDVIVDSINAERRGVVLRLDEQQDSATTRRERRGGGEPNRGKRGPKRGRSDRGGSGDGRRGRRSGR